jgi:hypothetical protein
MLDVIIEWSGWLVAIGMVIWKVVETLRNRPAIRFFVGLSETEDWLKLTVVNRGRRPVNLIEAGLQYPNGYRFDFPNTLNVQLGWFYTKQPKFNQLSLENIKEFISEIGAPTVAKFIYFTAENGDNYKVKIPNDIRDKLKPPTKLE